MKTRRLTIVGLSVIAAVSLAVGGCAKSDNGGTAGSAPSASPSPADPKSVLLASVQQLSKTTYKYSIESEGLAATGAVDPANKGVTMTMSGNQQGVSMKMDFVIIGNGYWVKMDLGAANSLMKIPTGKFMHLDATKFSKDNMINAGEGADMVSGMFDGLLDVKQVDSQHLTGTIDLTKVSKDSSFTEETLKKAGTKATSASFTAEVDSKGRLTKFTVDMAALGVDQPTTASYSDYGTAVTIEKPAASKIVEAPANVYEIFSS